MQDSKPGIKSQCCRFYGCVTRKICVLDGKVCTPASVEICSSGIAVRQNFLHVAESKLLFSEINYSGANETFSGDYPINNLKGIFLVVFHQK